MKSRFEVGHVFSVWGETVSVLLDSQSANEMDKTNRKIRIKQVNI